MRAMRALTLLLGLLLARMLQGASAKLSFKRPAPDALDRKLAKLQHEFRTRPELQITHALPHELPHELPPERRRAQETSSTGATWRPFRFKFDYRLDDSRRGEHLEYMETKLMPSIAAVIGSMVSVKVAEPPFTLPDLDGLSALGLDKLAAPPGVHDADMVMVVTSEPLGSQMCPERKLASATFLQTGKTVNRPVYGIAWFCTIDPARFVYDLEVGVHEVLHALGFLPSQFEQILPDYLSLVEDFLQDVTGDPIRGNSQFIDTLDDGQLAIVSPRVKNFARVYTGCDTLEGAPLEDDGGEGSQGAHWDTRVFDGEMMDYMAGGLDQHAARHAMSALTLAYLEDTGWYDVDYNYAGMISYGYKAGCAIVAGTYQEALQDPAAAFYLCEPEGDNEPFMCTPDRTAVGRCLSRFAEDIEDFYRVRLVGPEVKNEAGDVFTFECAGIEPGLRCLDAVEPYQGGKNNDPDFAPMCRNMSCSADGKVLVEGEPCEDTFGTLGWACPDAETFCGSPGWLTCVDTLDDCSKHGDCHEGRCDCHLGWGGEKCDVALCYDQCLNGSACPPSGYCGVTRKPTETFEAHLQRIYGVQAAAIPEDYKGLAETSGCLKHAFLPSVSALALAAVWLA